MIRGSVQLAAECLMIGTVICALPFAIVFAAAAMLRGGVKPASEKQATVRARETNGKGHLVAP